MRLASRPRWPRARLGCRSAGLWVWLPGLGPVGRVGFAWFGFCLGPRVLHGRARLALGWASAWAGSAGVSGRARPLGPWLLLAGRAPLFRRGCLFRTCGLPFVGYMERPLYLGAAQCRTLVLFFGSALGLAGGLARAGGLGRFSPWAPPKGGRLLQRVVFNFWSHQGAGHRPSSAPWWL